MAQVRRDSSNKELLKRNSYLQQFVLDDVRPTGKKLGTGSYGSVEQVKYKRLVCAAKMLHEVLVEEGNEGLGVIADKYLQECLLMSSLRHPNITLFLGLCFLPGIRLPLLVMEQLETSLDAFLNVMPKFSLAVKQSILKDVASGLFYLHERDPYVIHRDLTAKNVLLTPCLVAKITDMGNSRIIDMRSDRMAHTLSQLPGTLVYMPPEALDSSNRTHYGTPLDIFSFGHLAVYTIIQEFPCNLLPSTHLDPDNQDQVRGRTELERRKDYITLMDENIGDSHPNLVQMVKQCLHNAPHQRPTADQVLTLLEEVLGEVNSFQLDFEKMRVAKEMKMKLALEERLAAKEDPPEDLDELTEIVEDLGILSQEVQVLEETEEVKAEKSRKLSHAVAASQLDRKRNIIQALEEQQQRQEQPSGAGLAFPKPKPPKVSPKPPRRKISPYEYGNLRGGNHPSYAEIQTQQPIMPSSYPSYPLDSRSRDKHFTLPHTASPDTSRRYLGRLENQAWYWHSIDREIAKNCMTGKPDGSFLIRDATTPREYTLFVQNKGSIKYVRILSSRGKYGLADPKIFTTEPVLGSFPSVIALVDYFSTNSLAKFNHSLDVTLSYPLSKFRLVGADPHDYVSSQSPKVGRKKEKMTTDHKEMKQTERFKKDLWYCDVDRVKASYMLKGAPNGTFLCRPAGQPERLPSGARHTHTLDLMYNGVRHLKVMEKNGRFGFTTQCHYTSLTELVLHFTINTLVAYNPSLDITLQYPIMTQPYAL